MACLAPSPLLPSSCPWPRVPSPGAQVPRGQPRSWRACHPCAGHWAYQDTEGVAVWNFIVDQALEIDGLQLEVDGDVDQPGREASVRKTGSAGPSCCSSPQRSCPMLTLQLAEEVLTHRRQHGLPQSPPVGGGQGCLASCPHQPSAQPWRPPPPGSTCGI